ncbi:hypothetical protein FOZ63_032849, partial [Perkinsus olseni]
MCRRFARELDRVDCDLRHAMCDLDGEYYTLGVQSIQDDKGKRAIVAAVLSRGCIINIFNAFNLKSRGVGRGDPPSPLEIGISLSADGHFRSLRGAGGIILLGCNHTWQDGAVTRWSLSPLIGGIASSESRSNVEFLLRSLKVVVSWLFPAESAEMSVTDDVVGYLVADSSKGIVSGVASAIPRAIPTRCKYHTVESSKKVRQEIIETPYTKEQIVAYAKARIEGLYQCAGKGVQEAYLKVIQKEMYLRFGAELAQHYMASWQDWTNGAFYHWCPLALVQDAVASGKKAREYLHGASNSDEQPRTHAEVVVEGLENHCRVFCVPSAKRNHVRLETHEVRRRIELALGRANDGDVAT